MFDSLLRASIVIVTFHRPKAVRDSVESVLSQNPSPYEVIVVDGSINDETEHALSDLKNFSYYRVNYGYGHMTRARNFGLMKATGDICIFIDDDAVAHIDWLKNMLLPYKDENVGAVGGRALNHNLGEDTNGINEIGKLNARGELTGFFAANPGAIQQVDHIIGCNMSFRMSLLRRLGQLREYPGTEVREETDTCLRIRNLGYKIVFNPAACVDHIGAPHPHKTWKRFDARYDYFANHNHMLLLIRNYGPAASIVWNAYFHTLRVALITICWKLMAAVIRGAATIGGITVGIMTGLLESTRATSTPKLDSSVKTSEIPVAQKIDL